MEIVRVGLDLAKGVSSLPLLRASRSASRASSTASRGRETSASMPTSARVGLASMRRVPAGTGPAARRGRTTRTGTRRNPASPRHCRMRVGEDRSGRASCKPSPMNRPIARSTRATRISRRSGTIPSGEPASIRCPATWGSMPGRPVTGRPVSGRPVSGRRTWATAPRSHPRSAPASIFTGTGSSGISSRNRPVMKSSGCPRSFRPGIPAPSPRQTT